MTPTLDVTSAPDWTLPATAHLAARDLVKAHALRVFPVYEPNGLACACPSGANCAHPGKHPRTRHGLKDASADLAQIDRWWQDWPTANIGVATGRESGVVVLDVDGDVGRQSLAMLPALPNTWRSRTGRGEHVWFAPPGGGVGNRVGFRPGLDLRGDGGYVLAPPSRHVSGTAYAWRVGPSDVELAPMPGWLVELVRAPEPHASTVAPECWLEGTRNDRLWRLTRSLHAQGFPSDLVATLVQGANTQQCLPPLPASEVADILRRGAVAAHREDFVGTGPGATAPAPVEPLGIGAGGFLQTTYPRVRPLVEGVLNDDGSGWIGGEEKLGKTFYALEEALCLALGLPVCGRFPVPEPVPVLFVEEEDSARRTQNRIRALLRGHGLDPTDPALLARLDEAFFLSVWAGFSFDVPAQVQALELRIAQLRPQVVYVDVLRKVTAADLNKQDQAARLLGELDRLRRTYGCVFRVIHHFRKSQGFRSGRGSQEIGGSYVLGAWAENSIFFEPTSRRSGGPATIDIQLKDGAPLLKFQMRIVDEGETTVRLVIDEVAGDRNDAKARVAEALATLGPVDEPQDGHPGASVQSLMAAVKLSEVTVRRALKALQEEEQAQVVGHAAKGKQLWSLVTAE